MTVSVYCLLDPRNDDVRYVGITVNPSKRLNRHNYNGGKAGHHCASWIGSLHELGLKPIMDIIDECEESDWQEREKYWIQVYKNLGADLTNGTDGGDGLSNPSEIIRRKISASKIGMRMSDEQKKKLSMALSGENHPMYGMRGANHPAYGRRHSPETLLKMSKSRLGQHRSDETKRKMSLAQRGEKNPHYGKHPSEKTLQKKSLAMKLRWMKKRETSNG